jgi:hypothetical protein
MMKGKQNGKEISTLKPRGEDFVFEPSTFIGPTPEVPNKHLSRSTIKGR